MLLECLTADSSPLRNWLLPLLRLAALRPGPLTEKAPGILLPRLAEFPNLNAGEALAELPMPALEPALTPALAPALRETLAEADIEALADMPPPTDTPTEALADTPTEALSETEDTATTPKPQLRADSQPLNKAVSRQSAGSLPACS